MEERCSAESPEELADISAEPQCGDRFVSTQQQAEKAVEKGDRVARAEATCRLHFGQKLEM
jgi:hypothetical protein